MSNNQSIQKTLDEGQQTILANKIIGQVKPLIDKRNTTIVQIGKVIADNVIELDQASLRKVLTLVKEQVDIYSKGYLWEAYQIYHNKPELLDNKDPKLSISHYRTLYRVNIPDSIRAKLENESIENNLSVLDLKDRIREYQDEKLANFKTGDVGKRRDIKQEIHKLIRDLSLPELQKVLDMVKQIDKSNKAIKEKQKEKKKK